MATAEVVLKAFPDMTHTERTVKGTHGDIILSIFRPKGLTGKLPAIYWMHGGGVVMGNRFMGGNAILEACREYGLVCISVEYRLAPENPYPAPTEDCYDGLKWVGANAAELEIDPEKLLISGASGGGNMAAGTMLMVRDRGGPKIFAQVLLCPMLDCRGETASAKLYHDGAIWGGVSNDMAWKAILGGKEPDIYAAPALATDLSGLPQTYIDVGSAEMFTDEDVAYAQLLQECGVPTELHVWQGAFHGYEALLPSSKLAQIATATRTAWIGRVLGLSPRSSSDAKL